MSTLTDERVVQMKFDNKQFNKNVKKSTSVFEKFKNSLNLSGSAKSVNKALEDTQTNTNGISTAVQNVTAKFSLWEKVALSVVNRITNRVIDLGERMVKSLSVDNISDGWTKFNDNVRLQSTLLAQGFEQANIDAAIKKLEAYSDATSYSATSMTSAMQLIANSTEMSLDEASSLVTGFANQMAAAGATIYEFSGASNMLTKAISQGYLSGIAFKSLNETYKIITNEFKDQAVQAALANGTLIKTGEDLYRGMNSETEYTMKQLFSEGLTAEKWLTTDVMQNMYSSYAFASDQLNQLADQTGDSFYNLVNKFSELNDDELKISLKEVLGITDETEVEMFKLSLNALKAAQECRSLSDAFNAIKDAVSSGWKKSFQYIIGDVNQTKELWSNVYDALEGIFLNDTLRNEALKTWNEIGGRADLFNEETGALFQLLGVVQDLTTAFRETFNEIFFGSATPGADTVSKILKSITETIQKASTALRNFVNNNLNTIQNVLRVIFSVIKMGGTAIKFVWNLLKQLVKVLTPLQKLLGGGSKGVAELVAKISDKFSKWTTSSNLITRTIQRLGNVITSLTNKLMKFKILDRIKKTFNDIWRISKNVSHSLEAVGDGFVNTISKIKDVKNANIGLQKSFDKLFAKFSNKKTTTETENTVQKTETILFTLTKSLKKTGKLLANIMVDLLWILNKVLGGIDKFLKKFNKTIKKVSEYFKLFGKAFKMKGIKPEETVDERNKRILESFKPLVDFLYGLKDMCDGILTVLGKVLTQIGNKLKQVEDPVGKIKESIQKIKDAFKDAKNWASEHEGITIALIALAGVIAIIITFLVVFLTLNGKLKILSKAALQYTKSLKWKALAEFIKAIGTTIATITASIVILGALPLEQLKKGTVTLGIIMATLSAFVIAVTLLAGKMVKDNNLAADSYKTTFGSKKGIFSRDTKTNPLTSIINSMAYLMTSLAISVAALTISIYLLGKMNIGTLKQGGVALTILVASLTGITIGMSYLSALTLRKQPRGTQKVSDLVDSMTTFMMKLGMSMLKLALALFLISKIKTDTYIKGLFMLAGMLTVVSFAVKILQGNTEITELSTKGKDTLTKSKEKTAIDGVADQIRAMSVAMIGLAAACFILGKLKWTEIKKAAVMLPLLSASLLAISLSIKIMTKIVEKMDDDNGTKTFWKKIKDLVKKMGALITGVSAILGITRLLLKIKKINLSGATEVIVSLGVATSLLIASAASMRLITMILNGAFSGNKTNSKQMENWKKSLLSMASVLIAVSAISGVIAMFANTKPSNIAMATFAISAISGVIILTSYALSKSIPMLKNIDIKEMHKIGVVIGSLVMIGGLMAAMGQMKVSTMAKGALGVSLAMISLVGAVGAMAAIGTIASKADLASVSLLRLVPSLVVVGAMMAFFGQMKVKTIIKGTLGLVAALGILVGGVAILGVLASIAAPVLAPLSLLITIIHGLSLAMLQLSIAMALLSVIDMTSVSANFGAMCDALIQNAPKLTEAFKVLFAGVLQAILFALISIRSDLKQYITDTLKDLVTEAPVWASQVVELIILVLAAIEERSREISNHLMGILIGLVKGITDRIDELVVEVFNFLEKFWESVVREFTARAHGWVKKLFESLWAAVKGSWSTLKSIGSYLLDGILEGLGDIGDKLKNACSKITSGIKKIFGIHSPSKVMRDEVGTYLTQGIAKGMEDEIGSIDDATNSISNAIMDGIDDNLTITPVLDLSEIQNGVNQMDSMMTDNYTIGTTTAQAANSSFNRRTADGQYSSSSITNSNDQYTINNVFNVTQDVNPDELAESVMKSLNDKINARNSFRATKRYV